MTPTSSFATLADGKHALHCRQEAQHSLRKGPNDGQSGDLQVFSAQNPRCVMAVLVD